MTLKTHIVFKRFSWFLPYSNTVYCFYEFISNHDDYSKIKIELKIHLITYCSIEIELKIRLISYCNIKISKFDANWQLEHSNNVASAGFGRYKKNRVPSLLSIIKHVQTRRGTPM